jgi:3-phosphoshikimate 1-carboxyvinyltransferase
LSIRPAKLSGIDVQLATPSAQVKSALLLAGWGAQGETCIRGAGASRDHTERMLAEMGALVSWSEETVLLESEKPLLAPLNLAIPGDFSSAAFLIVAGILVENSELRLANVGLNPTRTGLLDVLWRMGADIAIEEETIPSEHGEPFGALRVRSSRLKGTGIDGGEIVRAIDELPVLAVAATQAEGETIIQGASELRVKETDRIGILVGELRRLGAEIEELPDGMAIWGPTLLKGGDVSPHGDHRLAMALAIAGLVSSGETRVAETDCIQDSFPGFEGLLVSLGAELI